MAQPQHCRTVTKGETEMSNSELRRKVELINHYRSEIRIAITEYFTAENTVADLLNNQQNDAEPKAYRSIERLAVDKLMEQLHTTNIRLNKGLHKVELEFKDGERN